MCEVSARVLGFAGGTEGFLLGTRIECRILVPSCILSHHGRPSEKTALAAAAAAAAATSAAEPFGQPKEFEDLEAQSRWREPECDVSCGGQSAVGEGRFVESPGSVSGSSSGSMLLDLSTSCSSKLWRFWF